MKKNIYKVLALMCVVGALSSCKDVNDKFDGFEEIERPEGINKLNLELDMTPARYTRMIGELDEKGNETHKAAASFFKKNNAFSDEFGSAEYMPFLLAKDYYTASIGSTALMTYDFIVGRNGLVADYTGDAHVVNKEEYKSVWGDKFPESFTPKISPEKNLPKILKAAYPDATEGMAKNISYNYSSEEPIDVTVVGEVVWDENWQDVEPNTDLATLGWYTTDLIGKYKFAAKEYKEDRYVEVSSFKSGGKNDIWLVTPATAVPNKADMQFSFEFADIRNFTAQSLDVYVSDAFDKNAGIDPSKWTKITDKFNIPDPEDGKNYTGIVKAGDFSLDAYKNKTVYFAFRYQGDDSPGASPKKTTTYRLDNFKIYEGAPGIDVEKKDLAFALYEFKDNAWKPVSNRDVLLLEPADYTEMGYNYPNMKVDVAAEQLPRFLDKKFPFAMNGNTKVVVYKTKADDSYADEFKKVDGVWVLNTFKESRTEQFIFTTDKKWVFDPTLKIEFNNNKAAFQMVVDYVKETFGSAQPDVLDSRGNAEFYYGFSAYYPNISYRDVDRSKEKAYSDFLNGTPAPTDEQKAEFLNARTVEGLAAYLQRAYPDAKAETSGVKQFAEIQNVRIFKDPTYPVDNKYWNYRYQCIGDKTWKVISRSLLDDANGKVVEEQEINKEE